MVKKFDILLTLLNKNNEIKMHEGNWKCSKCSGSITQLPFEPTPGREGELLCIDCHKQKVANRPARDNSSRQMFEGNWKCSGCGGAITQLPFQPKSENNLVCRDCFQKR